MDEPTRRALSDYLLALADDELVLGHRDSEWCGHSPILEEDIAFANLALDEIGHAGLWYGLLAELKEKEPVSYTDRLIFFRSPAEYRCAQMVEHPKGDWAFSMLRQFLFDALEKVRLDRLAKSAYPPLGEAAAKVRREEIYHLRHTRAWVLRLSLGTAYSQSRMQTALEALWPDTLQLFSLAPDEAQLVEAGIAPGAGELQTAWEAELLPFLSECELSIPKEPRREVPRSQHTPDLEGLLQALQQVARLEPEATW
jgi:ring-1,2-phenylacetyl-CoA epoxidase subunit PaaC